MFSKGGLDKKLPRIPTLRIEITTSGISRQGSSRCEHTGRSTERDAQMLRGPGRWQAGTAAKPRGAADSAAAVPQAPPTRGRHDAASCGISKSAKACANASHRMANSRDWMRMAVPLPRLSRPSAIAGGGVSVSHLAKALFQLGLTQKEPAVSAWKVRLTSIRAPTHTLHLSGPRASPSAPRSCLGADRDYAVRCALAPALGDERRRRAWLNCQMIVFDTAEWLPASSGCH